MNEKEFRSAIDNLERLAVRAKGMCSTLTVKEEKPVIVDSLEAANTVVNLFGTLQAILSGAEWVTQLISASIDDAVDLLLKEQTNAGAAEICAEEVKK